MGCLFSVTSSVPEAAAAAVGTDCGACAAPRRRRGLVGGSLEAGGASRTAVTVRCRSTYGPTGGGEG